MSASAGGGHQPSQSRAIPTRTVAISDAAQLPQDYCTTPGGTLFSTTPGGELSGPARHRRWRVALYARPAASSPGHVCRSDCVLQNVHSARQDSSLELPFGFWRREVGEGDPARNRPLTYLAVLRAPGRGWQALCMPRPVLSSFGSIVYFVGGVITGQGSPRLENWQGVVVVKCLLW